MIAQSVRVLLVDDQMLVRAGLRAVLERSPGMSVVGEATTKDEAVHVVWQCKPDVAIIDLEMPHGGGLDTMRALAAGTSPPAVVALTAFSEEEGLVQALDAGARGYLMKDLAEAELAVAVRRAASGEVYLRTRLEVDSTQNDRWPERRADPNDARARFATLSDREQTVLKAIAEGYTGPEIGRTLGITAKTVDTYKQRIQQKTGLAHRTEYIRFALNIDLLKK